MKLYVWTGFCPDYLDGLAFAIAGGEEEARHMVVASLRDGDTAEWAITWGELTVHELDTPVAFAVAGGG